MKFRQLPYLGVAAHWGIFLSDSDCPYIDKPDNGTLFHATSQWTDCLNLHLLASQPRDTPHERNYYNNLYKFPSLSDYWLLANTEVNDVELSDACRKVSISRGLNILTTNCQEWVKEVIQFLVNNGRINGNALLDMELHGFVTLSESYKRCCSKSSSLSCSCKT